MSNDEVDRDSDAIKRTETEFQIHAEHDGHINDARTRSDAENLVEIYNREYPHQDHEIVEKEVPV